MKSLLPLLLVMACGSRSQDTIAAQPSAIEPWHHKEAPPASTSDADRYGVRQGFEDMETTQNAYHEAQVSSDQSRGVPVKKQRYPPRFPPEKTPKPPQGPAQEAPKQSQ